MSLLELIADPIRLRILRQIAREGPASLQELADAAGVHVNTVRAHVVALEYGGALVSGVREHPGRGRQGREYALREGWSLGAEDFRAIAEILATVITREGVTSEDLVVLGREWGRYMLGRPGTHDAEKEVVRALERFGHLAQMEGRTLHLTGCPCPLVSPDNPRVVCDLAIGVAEGVLEGSGSDLRVSKRDHRHEVRNCQVTLAKPKRSGRVDG